MKGEKEKWPAMPEGQEDADDLITPTQAAEVLGLTRAAIYHRLHRGLIPPEAIVVHPHRLTDRLRFRKALLVAQ